LSDTLGSLRTEILLWLRGDLLSIDDQALINASINDAIEEIWMALMEVQIARFLGVDSPVTFSLAAQQERVQLVTIADPTIAPVVGQAAGGQLGARNYLVAYTYVTESGAETQLSPTTPQAIGANQLAQVTPPAPGQGIFGWNCYVSVSNNPQLMALQNQQPLPFTAAFTEIPTGWQDYSQAEQQPPQVQVATGPTPAGSPPPSENSTGDNISWITHLEVRTSDTVLRSWNQYGIHSEIMRRYGRTQASASEYQTYVWDLINGNRLEIRPTTGTAFNPRYWYVAKPRRLRYDPAQIPYTQITGVHQFLVDKSLSRLKLSLDEYLSSQAFGSSAENGKMMIRRSLGQENWAKDMRIQPHLY
jgi:hypothetical protein